MIKFIVILILLVVIAGAAYYFFNKKGDTAKKVITEKIFKYAVYNKPNCTGEVIRSAELASGVPYAMKLEVKSQKGDEQKACCMKLENVRINDGFARNEAGKEIFEPTDSMKNMATGQIELEGCSKDYMFSFSPLQ
jgi:hypothetical protein